MKINPVKITQSIELADYNEAMSGGVVHVWVNPPKSMRREREQLLRAYATFFRGIAAQPDGKPEPEKKKLARVLRFFRGGKNEVLTQMQETKRRVYAWFAELWSQGSNPELHWTTDEVSELNEHDPALYQWLIRKSVLMVDGFLADKKK